MRFVSVIGHPNHPLIQVFFWKISCNSIQTYCSWDSKVVHRRFDNCVVRGPEPCNSAKIMLTIFKKGPLLTFIAVNHWAGPNVKGHLGGFPNSVAMVFVVFNLGILGDSNP